MEWVECEDYLDYANGFARTVHDLPRQFVHISSKRALLFVITRFVEAARCGDDGR